MKLILLIFTLLNPIYSFNTFVPSIKPKLSINKIQNNILIDIIQEPQLPIALSVNTGLAILGEYKNGIRNSKKKRYSHRT